MFIVYQYTNLVFAFWAGFASCFTGLVIFGFLLIRKDKTTRNALGI